MDLAILSDRYKQAKENVYPPIVSVATQWKGTCESFQMQ